MANKVKYGPKNWEQGMGAIVRDNYDIPEDEPWMDYVEQHKNLKKIFKQLTSEEFQKEYKHYDELREKFCMEDDLSKSIQLEKELKEIEAYQKSLGRW